MQNSYQVILADFNAQKAALANRRSLADLQSYAQENQRFKNQAAEMQAQNQRLEFEAMRMRQQNFADENRRNWEDMQRKSNEFMNR